MRIRKLCLLTKRNAFHCKILKGLTTVSPKTTNLHAALDCQKEKGEQSGGRGRGFLRSRSAWSTEWAAWAAQRKRKKSIDLQVQRLEGSCVPAHKKERKNHRKWKQQSTRTWRDLKRVSLEIHLASSDPVKEHLLSMAFITALSSPGSPAGARMKEATAKAS